MTSWTSPFQEWMNQDMVGIAASPEVMLLLAKAFDGGKRHEREACAKVCENLPTPKDATTLTHIPTLETCAAAIRARGDK